VEFAVMNYQIVQLDYADEPPTWAWVRLWDYTSLLVAGNHPLTQQVRNAIEKFLTTWNLANKW
jgi:hypothetical protein